MAGKYLTKSRFKIGSECLTKLFYNDSDDFANANDTDAFLKALAEGGFQVGELAKLYYPGGVQVDSRKHLEAAEETRKLLERDNVVIFEAALLYKNCFVRVDVLEKTGRSIKLMEVKAKSWRDGDSFTTKKGDKIDSDWESYIADIAFQTFVAMRARPEFIYTSFLMLADKGAVASVDGIHQKFVLKSADKERTYVEVVPGTTMNDLGAKILKPVSVDSEIDLFTKQTFEGQTFEEFVVSMGEIVSKGTRSPPKLTRNCGNCEYRVDNQDLEGKRSGFNLCFSEAAKLTEDALSSPMIFDIWNLHYMKKDKLVQDGRFLMAEVRQDDIGPEDDTSIELTAKQRQWLQVEMFQNKSTKPWFDNQHFVFRGRSKEKWKPPFHFIDFETITASIPFYKGLRPYETVAFQFSHHVVDSQGRVLHVDQFINTKPGVFPNFEFIRALHRSLSGDNGTVFRYATHENTVLNHIRAQLLESNEKDKQELIAFIETLTTRKANNKEVHRGPRAMVDMCELVKKYYYSPLMGGSNSIKKVLPAVLRESSFLKNKYSKPIYGLKPDLTSLNFQGKQWFQLESDGSVADPYALLEPIFEDVDKEVWRKFERVFQDDEIKEGGAASTAYARMQFTKMSDQERRHIEKALLRYCELDTLAMVMIWEYWTQELLASGEKVA